MTLVYVCRYLQVARAGDRQYYQMEFASPEVLSDADLLSLRAGWRLLRTYAERHQVGLRADVGARLSVAWRRPLLNEKGHSIEVTSELSQVRQSMDFRYGIPWRHPINDTLQIIAGFKREDIDSGTITNNAILGVERQKKRESGWQTNESIRWSRESYSKTNGETGQSDLLLPGYAISRVRTKGSKTDPTSGDRQYYQMEFASSDIGDDDTVTTA